MGGLDFRKLRHFNLAILTKQGWKFLTTPSPFASRVFQARYYPQDTFLDASIGTNLSYVWRSIMATPGLLRQGAQRRIGLDRHVKIWNILWLPDHTNPYIESVSPPDLQNATVESLRSYMNGSLVSEIKN